MTMETEILLTDEFVAFSQKVTQIHATKKARQAEVKKLYDAFLLEMKGYDEQVAVLKTDWEKFAKDGKKHEVK